MKKFLSTFRVPICVLFFVLIANTGWGFAQDTSPITIQKGEVSIFEVFKVIKKQTGLTVFYTNQLLNDKEKVKVDFNQVNLSVVMDYVLKEKNIAWAIQDQYIVLKKKEQALSHPISSDQKSSAIKIQGRVLDGDGAPVGDVTVKVKDTQIGTITSGQGFFTINVPDNNAILVFSHVGYQTLERTVGNATTFNITLKHIAGSLDEVVVIAYGTQARKDLTGAVSTVNVEDMQKAPVASYIDALAGRVAGLSVISNDGQPGAGSQVVIRGASVTQDASPLYVIDGFPIENMDINSINPNDIESIQVLKDASSIAIYGARGSNGVILISTKRGKEGPPRINYSYSAGIQNDVKRLKVMSPYEFVKLQLEMDSLASTPAAPVTVNHKVYLDPTKGVTLDSYRNAQGIDWQNEILQKGMVQSHSLNINAGNATTRYSLSGSYYDQKGIIINTGMKRYEGRFALDQTVNKNVRLGVTLSYSSTPTFGTIPAANAIAASGFGGGVVQAMYQYRPVNGVGSQNLLSATIDSLDLVTLNNGTATTLGDNLINPRVQAENEYRKTTYNTGVLNAFLEYSFFKKFKFKISGGFNSTTLRSELFYNSNTQQGNLFTTPAGVITNTNGINGQNAYVYNKNYLNEDILSYKTNIGKNQVIDALAGFTYQYANSYGDFYRSINIPTSAQGFGLYSLGAGTPSTINVNYSQWQLYSFLSRVNYTLFNRYLFTATIRSDGSSKFAPGNAWGYFPSGAFAWRFTDEPFLKSLKNIVNYGKFRVSYGAVGNNRVGDYSYAAQFAGPVGQFGYPLNNVYTKGIAPFFYGNSDLRWETTKQLDIGFDLNFLHDRISVNVDYYHKQTNDFLLNVTIPALSGYALSQGALQFQNTGSIVNKGFEFTINTTNISTKDFSWYSNLNISFNKGTIGSFYSGVEAILNSWNFAGSSGLNNAWIAKSGESISQFYGYKWDGVYQYSDFDKLANGTYVLKNGLPTYSTAVKPGDPKYKDLNGDGTVDINDQTTLGSPLPIHTGGFSNNFTYKNLSLNVFMQWSYGNKVLNGNNVQFNTTGGYFFNGNQFATYADRWTPTNPTNDIPRAMYNIKGDVGSVGGQRPSSRFIEDGSFLRLKTISLSYKLPETLLKKIGIQNISLSASAQNILTWTKYTGSDPEVSTFRVQNSAATPLGGIPGATNSSGAGNTFVSSSSSYTALVGGFDSTAYPRAFTLTFGINATF